MNDHLLSVEDALVGVLTAPARHPGLYGLARPLYRRELRVREAEGGVTAEIDKVGYPRYKRSRRYRNPAPPPAINTASILSALNAVLPGNITATSIEDNGTYITIHFI